MTFRMFDKIRKARNWSERGILLLLLQNDGVLAEDEVILATDGSPESIRETAAVLKDLEERGVISRNVVFSWQRGGTYIEIAVNP